MDEADQAAIEEADRVAMEAMLANAPSPEVERQFRREAEEGLRAWNAGLGAQEHAQRAAALVDYDWRDD